MVFEVRLLADDKDGGWSVMPPCVRQLFFDDVLSGNNFTEVHDLACCERLVELEHILQWKTVFGKSWLGSTVVAKLKLLLKSNQPSGEAC